MADDISNQTLIHNIIVKKYILGHNSITKLHQNSVLLRFCHFIVNISHLLTHTILMTHIVYQLNVAIIINNLYHINEIIQSLTTFCQICFLQSQYNSTQKDKEVNRSFGV